MAELIGEVRNDTVENVERKQARTEGEREESEGEISEEEEDPDDDDDIPYNPKVSKSKSFLYTVIINT